MDPKLKKWLRWFDVIKSELEDLVVAKYTFREVQLLIEENSRLHKPGSFYDYFAQTYVSHVVIGLRRQIKSDAQGISMARLFEEMIDFPKTLSRKYYVGLYKDTSVEVYADEDFNKFSAPGWPHIDAALVAADLARLKAACSRCEDFADKRVAHRDTCEPIQLPTFSEVDKCIDLLDQLCVRYYLLFHASGMESLLPTWQYDWKAIFREPWIPPIDWEFYNVVEESLDDKHRPLIQKLALANKFPAIPDNYDLTLGGGCRCDCGGIRYRIATIPP